MTLYVVMETAQVMKPMIIVQKTAMLLANVILVMFLIVTELMNAGQSHGLVMASLIVKIRHMVQI